MGILHKNIAAIREAAIERIMVRLARERLQHDGPLRRLSVWRQRSLMALAEQEIAQRRKVEGHSHFWCAGRYAVSSEPVLPEEQAEDAVRVPARPDDFATWDGGQWVGETVAEQEQREAKADAERDAAADRLADTLTQDDAALRALGNLVFDILNGLHDAGVLGFPKMTRAEFRRRLRNDIKRRLEGN